MPWRFWSLTRSELLVCLRAAVTRGEVEQRRLLYLAWHIAALQRHKRLPSMARLLGPTDEPTADDFDEARRFHDELQEEIEAALGGPGEQPPR